MASRLEELKSQNKLLAAERLEQRTNYDIEMLQETGFCHGVENYSRHLAGRDPGETPTTLIDFFPERLFDGNRRVSRYNSSSTWNV